MNLYFLDVSRENYIHHPLFGNKSPDERNNVVLIHPEKKQNYFFYEDAHTLSIFAKSHTQSNVNILSSVFQRIYMHQYTTYNKTAK